MDRERFSLAELVDWLALDGPRDRSLVWRTADWLQEHREHIEIEAVAALGWAGAVMTLQVDSRVCAVLTGHHPSLPGAWTWKVEDQDFPHLSLHRTASPLPEPVAFCALDFSDRGRRALLPTGDAATVQAAVLVDRRQMLRVRLANGEVHSFAREDVVLAGQQGDQPS